MVSKYQDYNLYTKFLDTFSPTGFKDIDPDNPIVLQLEAMTEANSQFFFIGDLIQVQILWTSQQSTTIIGIAPEEIDPYKIMEATHPDSLLRHTQGRTKMFKLGNDILLNQKGSAFLSTNLKIRDPKGDYPNLLFQLYLFYKDSPKKTVYLLVVLTNIESFKMKNSHVHYYAGENISLFRYPDNELLKIGNPLSDREFEIVKLIHSGLTSDQIAEKLFLSPYTVNTHRANILKKTGKNNIADLIYELTDLGLI